MSLDQKSIGRKDIGQKDVDKVSSDKVTSDENLTFVKSLEQVTHFLKSPILYKNLLILVRKFVIGLDFSAGTDMTVNHEALVSRLEQMGPSDKVIYVSNYAVMDSLSHKCGPQLIMSKKRTYSEAYPDFGFTFIVNNGEHLPQCVICTKTLGNGSMKPFQLKQHLQGCPPPQLQNNDREYFKLKQNYLKKTRLDSTGKFRQQTDAIVTVSYEVSYKIVREKKPHRIGETLLLIFVLYTTEKGIAEEFFLCKPLQTTTKSQDMMDLINDFFEDCNISWDSLVGVCTTGALAMLGSRSAFVTLVKQKNPAVESTHCLIHIKVVNFIKGSALNTRLFHRLCEAMEPDPESLLFHTQVRELTKGHMLQRVLELFDELVAFHRAQKNIELLEVFEGEFFCVRLSYLSDIYSALKELNRKLQGKGTNVLFQLYKMRVFVAKLELWKKRAESGSFSSFLAPNECVGDMEDSMPNPIAENIKQHLEGL
ncbi:protein FAM200C-like [Palaemon carinicauda]|uniref:protein FAM200C-like n=1 Tax=Palaemon carinicauda TaxID=392227 RepID=UPI0035B5B843